MVRLRAGWRDLIRADSGEVVRGLEVEPELRRGAEEAGEPQGSVRRDGVAGGIGVVRIPLRLSDH